MGYPRNVRPPAWAVSFVEVVSSAQARISTVDEKTGLASDAVLQELAPGLSDLGYSVESGKTKAGKMFRPVLFGENGAPEVSYEIDAFHGELGIAVGCSLHGLAPAYPLPDHGRKARARHPRVRQNAQPAQRHLRFTAPPVAVRRRLANRPLASITCLQIAVSTFRLAAHLAGRR
jgi:hypothetical protein